MTSMRVLGGVRCDPATAVPVAKLGWATLYRTKSRQFFYQLESGELGLVGGYEAALVWLKTNAPAVQKTAALDPGPLYHMTVDLPPSLVARLDKARGKRSRKALVQAALEKFLNEEEQGRQ